MTQFSKNTKRLIALLVIILCYSCVEDLELSNLSFVGDSLVARWDLQTSFPASIVKNYGVSGSGITYMESLAGKFQCCTVVVISGTNDLYQIASKDDEKIKEYASRYMSAIRALKADKVYLYSIFPRGEQFNGKDFNPIIMKLNAMIEEEARLLSSNVHYINVYNSLLYKDFLNPQYTCDGLHLNKYGYALITSALISSI